MSDLEKQLKKAAQELVSHSHSVQRVLQTKGSRADYLTALDRVLELAAQMKKEAVDHTRKMGVGLRLDGQPDRRFRRRASIHATSGQ
jgi:hypothetical protein